MAILPTPQEELLIKWKMDLQQFKNQLTVIEIDSRMNQAAANTRGKVTQLEKCIKDLKGLK